MARTQAQQGRRSAALKTIIEEDSMAKKTYHCEGCGDDVTVDEKDPVPECCGAPMAVVPLDNCVKAQSAEQSRLEDADEACDDAVH